MHEVEVGDEPHLRHQVRQVALCDLCLTLHTLTHHKDQQRQLVIAAHLVHQRYTSLHALTPTSLHQDAVADLHRQRLHRLPDHVQLPQHAALLRHSLQDPRRARDQVRVVAHRTQAHVCWAQSPVFLFIVRGDEIYLNCGEHALDLNLLRHRVIDQILHDLSVRGEGRPNLVIAPFD